MKIIDFIYYVEKSELLSKFLYNKKVSKKSLLTHSFYSLFKKFITKSIITSFSFGLDSAINKVKAVNVLLSIICLFSLYKMP